jgi:hypothetical protein
MSGIDQSDGFHVAFTCQKCQNRVNHVAVTRKKQTPTFQDFHFRHAQLQLHDPAAYEQGSHVLKSLFLPGPKAVKSVLF